MVSYFPGARSHSCEIAFALPTPLRGRVPRNVPFAIDYWSLTPRWMLVLCSVRCPALRCFKAQPACSACDPRTPSSQDARCTACFFQSDLSRQSQYSCDTGYKRSWNPALCISFFAFLQWPVTKQFIRRLKKLGLGRIGTKWVWAGNLCAVGSLYSGGPSPKVFWGATQLVV